MSLAEGAANETVAVQAPRSVLATMSAGQLPITGGSVSVPLKMAADEVIEPHALVMTTSYEPLLATVAEIA